jgi:hypothetical protein
MGASCEIIAKSAKTIAISTKNLIIPHLIPYFPQKFPKLQTSNLKRQT